MKLLTMAKAGMAVLKGRLLGVDFPLFVILAATSQCQSRCNYCQIPRRPTRTMSTDDVFRLIDQITAMGTQRLGIWGGEPLLRPDIGDIVGYAKHRGLYVTLDTNGYLLPKRWNALKQVDHLILSLDGDREAHDANREPGSFDRVMDAMAALPPGRTVWTITVLTKRNLDQVDWLVDMGDRLGFVPTFQVLHHNAAMAGDTSDLMPSDAEYRAVLNKLIAMKRAGRKIGTSRAAFEHLVGWRDYSAISTPEPSPKFKRCWAGGFFANVDSDGSVYPCSLLQGEIPAPNFLEVGFAEAYRRLAPIPCQACLATCYTEYNLLFGLHFGTIMEWALAMGSRKFLGYSRAPKDHECGCGGACGGSGS